MAQRMQHQQQSEEGEEGRPPRKLRRGGSRAARSRRAPKTAAAKRQQRKTPDPGRGVRTPGYRAFYEEPDAAAIARIEQAAGGPYRGPHRGLP